MNIVPCAHATHYHVMCQHIYTAKRTFHLKSTSQNRVFTCVTLHPVPCTVELHLVGPLIMWTLVPLINLPYSTKIHLPLKCGHPYYQHTFLVLKGVCIIEVPLHCVGSCEYSLLCMCSAEANTQVPQPEVQVWRGR